MARAQNKFDNPGKILTIELYRTFEYDNWLSCEVMQLQTIACTYFK